MGLRGNVRLPGAFVIIEVLILALAGLGSLYQALATRRERRLYPPPGDLIDIGGRRLHMLRAGEQQPSVVLDAGLGAFSLDWGLVLPEVATFTTVYAYDRAGYGWSDPGPRPRTSRQITQDLHRLLHLARIPGPYILVGHSFGGFNVRLFADRYPAEVAGLVLVDASHEDEETYLPRRLLGVHRLLMRAALLVWLVGRVCSIIGLVRLAGERNLVPPFAAFDKLPPRLQRPARLLRYRPGYYATCYAEDVCYAESATQVRGAQIHRAMPAAVVVATGSDGLTADAAPLPGRAGQLVRTLRQQRQELQRTLARQISPEAIYMVAERSGHLIPLDQPEVVVEAIRRVVEAARR